MTVVKRKILPKGKVIKKSIPKERKPMNISTEMFIPSDNLFDYNIVIHGELGIGKTTLVNMFSNVYFIMWEKNDSYKLLKNNICCWEDFIDISNQLSKGKTFEGISLNFKTISLDGPKIGYEQAMSYACNKYGFDHPGGRQDFGNAWSKVRREFIKPINDIKNSKYNYNIITTCHTIDKEIEPLSGSKYHKLVPDISGQAFEFLVAPCDNVFYYYFQGKERWLQIVGDEHVTAKNRMEGHFLTPNSKAVHRIPMGNSKEEAYNNLINAFNNKQEKSYQEKEKEIVKKIFKKKG